ncbi:hypothetical protein BsWGS_07725 [Bradybaena similaris]
MSLCVPLIEHTWCRLSYAVRTLSSFQPQYNYGLSGKGKSSRSNFPSSSAPKVQGEVLFGLHPVQLALQAKKRKAFHCVYLDQKFQSAENRNSTVDEICDLATQHNLMVKFVTRNLLDILAGNRPHQGACLDVEELQVPEWNGHDVFMRSTSLPLWLLLHNVQDPMNFGAILRTAHYLGVDQVVVPGSDSCRLSPVVSKASAGALEMVSLMKLSKTTTEIDFCKRWQSQGGIVVGTGAFVDGSDRSVLLDQFSVASPIVLILGNEGSGLGRELEDCCDKILTIPGHEPAHLVEHVQSLNVSVAAGILLHWIRTSSIKS